MDSQVVAAMARWPDVPAVYGWLSLSQAGQWRLHPSGDALQLPDSPGEPITSPQILAFMDRNFDVDAKGQWFFQNGPQKVYIRLDAAPYILRTTTEAATGRLILRTHTGLNIGRVDSLYLDEAGRLFMATDRGPGLVAGRDLPALLDALDALATVCPADSNDTAAANDLHRVDTEEALTLCMEAGRKNLLTSSKVGGFPGGNVPLQFCPNQSLEQVLQFRRQPSPPADTAPASGPSGAAASGDSH